MKNSKFEIRNPKGLARFARIDATGDSYGSSQRAPRIFSFELLISNFEFTPCPYVLAE